jgi:hypothetical protein
MDYNLPRFTEGESKRRASAARALPAFNGSARKSLLKAGAALALVTGLFGLFDAGAQAQSLPVTAPIAGEIQSLTLNNPADPWSGGTMVVGGQNIILPRNLLMDLPANRLTLTQLFAQAPAACLITRESGLAKGDSCNGTGMGGIANVAANRTSAGNVIAGDVLIEKGAESVSGNVTYINYNQGWFVLNGNPADPTTGVMVRLNDPTARHSIQSGAGCLAGAVNCSADPRFALDADNYTTVSVTGYPLCIPSTVARPFPGLTLAAPVMAPAPISQANALGVGDMLCPSTNRTVAVAPVADSRRMAPILVGDSITAEGNFEKINGVQFLSAHTTKMATALSTQLVGGQPDYVFPDEFFIDAPGFQNQRIRSLFIGYTTVSPADVLIWSIHYDPVTNAKHEFPLGSSLGCDAAAGASTCTGQAIVAGASDTFRIRHDVDFGIGAGTKLDPCRQLRGDARFAPLNLCPLSAAVPSNVDNTNTGEMMGILSPIPHEVQVRTGRKMADLALAAPVFETLDVSGNAATNGQYLFPFGINLGGIDIPNFFEINLAQTATPFSFSGIPWNLDRRLSPGGCNGPCEATPQPLDPFPFEGVAMDPRLQALPTVVFQGLPKGTYTDPNYTTTPLANESNRILSFVNPARNRANGNGAITPAPGNFDGLSVLQWPPVNPAHINIVPTHNVNLTVAVAPNANQAPVAVNDAATTAFQRAVIVPVLDNDTDGDNDILTVSSVTQGTSGAVTTNGITATYTPMAGFAGNDSFSYTVVDGKGGVATANVTVTVNPNVNFAPVANTDNAAVIAGSAVTIAVLANDTDANGDVLTITGFTQGVRGTVVRAGNNLVYTALAGPAAVDLFTYTITDGMGGNATGTVNVTVGAVENFLPILAQFRTNQAEWRINGTSSVEGATVTARLGGIAGPVIGSAPVVAGVWTIVSPKGSPVIAGPGSVISIVSTGGTTRLAFPVTVRN